MQTVEAILKLNKIFKSNKWTERDIDEFVFDNFCKLLNNITEDQRKLIIELVDRYKWISFADYPEKILATIDKIPIDKINKLKKVYLFPIIKPEDEGKFKSGQFLLYQIKCFKRQLKNYKKIEFKYISKFDFFTDNSFVLKNNEEIFLIDDYVGSGETLDICLETIQINKKITNDQVSIITIVAQQEAYDDIRKKGYSMFAYYYSKKGLSDFNSSPLLEEKVKIMLEIEKMIPGGGHFSLGYNKSEALITMARTPDNTFPIFWKTYKKGNEKFEAPFSREETVEL